MYSFLHILVKSLTNFGNYSVYLDKNIPQTGDSFVHAREPLLPVLVIFYITCSNISPTGQLRSHLSDGTIFTSFNNFLSYLFKHIPEPSLTESLLPVLVILYITCSNISPTGQLRSRLSDGTITPRHGNRHKQMRHRETSFTNATLTTHRDT